MDKHSITTSSTFKPIEKKVFFPFPFSKPATGKMYLLPRSTILALLFFLLIAPPPAISQPPPPTVCIIGSGIGGSAVAHFLRQYAPSYNASTDFNIRIFERHSIVGGRMATVNIAGDTFEAGASILHPKNLHASSFTKLLNLTVKKPSSSDSFSLGIWDGRKFVFRTLSSGLTSKVSFLDKIIELWDQLVMFIRYGFSLLRMQEFVESAVGRFTRYYEGFETRPVFETVDEMLNWSGLYNLTTRSLYEELMDARLSRLLIQELVTVITRINYGQSVSISGLAGAVSLAGSGGGLWAVEGGNWQIAARLINHSDSTLHLQEEIESISYLGEYYEVKSKKGNNYSCELTVLATPLDELIIQFTPPITIPKRELQHTHTTFVRGLLNPGYFGQKTLSKIPKLVGTTENDDVPFSSISVLKQHDENDMTYKIFSRKPMEDTLLDKIFSVRKESIRIDWAAYPHFKAPEVFAPFILDGRHLYYVNAFENAASTMETSAVAAENIARLILSRFFATVGPVSVTDSSVLNPHFDRDASALHIDL